MAQRKSRGGPSAAEYPSELKLGPHVVELSSQSKVLFPKSKLTKGDLVAYYAAIAPVMLRHVKARPLSLQRFPGGIGGPGFFQKECPEYYPDYITRVPVAHSDGEVVDNCAADNAAALVYLANQNVIVLHNWLAKKDNIRRPDRVVLDFDPNGRADFAMVRDAALKARDMLGGDCRDCWPMVTGSRGIHVVMEVRRTRDYDAVAVWSRSLAQRLADAHPDLLTTEFYKRNRGDRIFVDWLRNQYAQTAVAPYSARAKEGAPVAVPISWEEVKTGKVGRGKSARELRPDLWTIRDAPELLKRAG